MQVEFTGEEVSESGKGLQSFPKGCSASFHELIKLGNEIEDVAGEKLHSRIRP